MAASVLMVDARAVFTEIWRAWGGVAEGAWEGLMGAPLKPGTDTERLNPGAIRADEVFFFLKNRVKIINEEGKEIKLIKFTLPH